MSNQPFYGKISSVSPENENFVLFYGDTSIGSNQITNITPDTGFSISLLRVGQSLSDLDNKFASNPTITNIVGTTLTVNQNATANGTQAFFAASTPSGTYFVASASFLDPNSVISVNDITGSQNLNFNGSTPIYTMIGAAATVPAGSLVLGRYHEYAITDVVYRNVGISQFSFFIEWNEEGTEASSGDQLFLAANQSLPIAALTPSSSLTTIFSPAIPGLEDVAIGSDVAGYQIALNNFLDDLVITETPRSGWSVASHNGESVALDLAMTPALISAGLVREVIRAIQEERKRIGLDISDRITVNWNAPAELAAAISSAIEEISSEVLATQMNQIKAEGTSESEIGLWLKLEKN